MKVFVYGTLKRGFSNHHILSGRSSLVSSDASIDGFKLFDLGAFPAAIMSADANDRIHGEVFEIHHDKLGHTLAALDRLEGHPTFYERQRREAIDETGLHHDVSVYVFLNHVRGAKLCSDGKWKGYGNESKGR